MRRIETGYANRLPGDDGMAIVFSKKELRLLKDIIGYADSSCWDSVHTGLVEEFNELMEVDNV